MVKTKRKRFEWEFSIALVIVIFLAFSFLMGILIGNYMGSKKDRLGKDIAERFCKEKGYGGFSGFGKADYSYAESELYVYCHGDDLGKSGEFICKKASDKECKNPKFLGSEGNMSAFPIDSAFEKSEPVQDAKFRYYNGPEGSAFWKCEED